MKHIQDLAQEYAQKYYPLGEWCDNDEVIKHGIAYRAFTCGFNEAMRILMEIGNVDTSINKPGSIDLDKESVWEEE